jgi:uncharacterized heparinase superfamily protein
MTLADLSRRLRRTLAKLPQLGLARVPDAPLPLVRDLWPGDATRGANLLRGEIELGGMTGRLTQSVFTDRDAAAALRAAAYGFVWLRDLRALGTDAARMQARSMVDAWMGASPRDRLAERPDIAGSRIAAWLGHYDFFASSADDGFRQTLMAQLVADARTLSALLPAEELDGRALTALKGLIAAGVGLPEQHALLARAQRLLPAEVQQQVLPDGMHCERGPAQHLAALQDMLEIRALLQAGQALVPPTLTQSIERMAAVLRAFRHGDGRLALFNGTREDLPVLVETVLAQAGRGGRAPAVMPHGGFVRLTAGRTIVIADCGSPAGPGRDRFAQAGTLSFEMSVGRDRMIVNCGAAPAAASGWREAACATAAHSTLVIADTSSSEVLPNGLGRRPGHVLQQHQDGDGAHWLDMSHDGWMLPFHAVHHRRLYLSDSGEDIRGEDRVEADSPQPFAIRFHLHPSVDASLQRDGEAVLISLPNGGGWKLMAQGAKISLEESIYLGGHTPRKSEQVVLTGYEDGPQTVNWAITRLG